MPERKWFILESPPRGVSPKLSPEPQHCGFPWAITLRAVPSRAPPTSLGTVISLPLQNLTPAHQTFYFGIDWPSFGNSLQPLTTPAPSLDFFFPGLLPAVRRRSRYIRRGQYGPFFCIRSFSRRQLIPSPNIFFFLFRLLPSWL